MAIDLCHKSPGPLAERDPGPWDDAVPSESVLLDDLGTDQRDALNFAYRTTLSNVDPRLSQAIRPPGQATSATHWTGWRSGWTTGPTTNSAATRCNHPDPVMREQALFEYADRDHADAIELLEQAVRTDTNREVRWDALWAIEKLAGAHAVRTLQKFTTDADPEIAEWARLFGSELQTGDPSVR